MVTTQQKKMTNSTLDHVIIILMEISLGGYSGKKSVGKSTCQEFNL
jgi:hypothetical protein